MVILATNFENIFKFIEVLCKILLIFSGHGICYLLDQC